MTTVTIYNIVNGRIRQNFTGPAAMVALQLQEGEAAIDGRLLPSRYLIVDGEAIERPSLAVADATIPADGADHVILAELPAGTEVVMDGEPQGASEGGPLILAATVPGIVEVSLAPPFPTRPASFKVTVEEVE